MTRLALLVAIAMASVPSVAVAGVHPEYPCPMPPRTLTGPTLMLTDGDGHYVSLLDEGLPN